MSREEGTGVSLSDEDIQYSRREASFLE